MKTVMVRYKTRPECAAENEALIKGVFDSLAWLRPAGLAYQAFRLADGVSFVHLARIDEEAADGHPLLKLEAFQQFLVGIQARCEEPPVSVELTPLGQFESEGAPQI
jgi:hypothetical protein